MIKKICDEFIDAVCQHFVEKLPQITLLTPWMPWHIADLEKIAAVAETDMLS